MSAFQHFLIKFGFQFADPEDEARFHTRYLAGWILVSQFLLVGGALFYYVFFVWDDLVDPANSGTTQMIRGLIVAPLMIGSAVALLTRFGRKHAETIMLLNLTVGQIGLIWIYSLLEGGFKFVSVGVLLVFIGVTSAFPIRSKWLAPASLFVLVSTIAGQLYADNTSGRWLIVNVLLVVCGITFGSISTYIRERAARIQFMTNKELEASRARVDELLHSILPRDIVQRIQAGETAIAESLGEVSIIFADLVGFTELSRKLSPIDLIKMLSRLFSAFDREAERFGIDRIKTIGDAYMAIGGLGRAVGRDHAEDAADFALAIQAAVRKVVEDTGLPIAIRVGLHIGPVVAGVIGRRRPAFDCWGEAVNLASRLESNAPHGAILISESGHWRLKERFDVEPFDAIELKGIGLTQSYLLGPRKVERTGLRLVDRPKVA